MLVVVRFDEDWSNPKFVDLMKFRSCAEKSVDAFNNKNKRIDEYYNYKIYKNIWSSEKQFIREYNEGTIKR